VIARRKEEVEKSQAASLSKAEDEHQAVELHLKDLDKQVMAKTAKKQKKRKTKGEDGDSDSDSKREEPEESDTKAKCTRNYHCGVRY
jgi:hypothetical protein